ncbi:MAG: DEAD/DEAH box helicase family protein, partial [Dehalococcoidia bacterium]
HLVDDLLMAALAAAGRPLDEDALAARVDAAHLLAGEAAPAVRLHLAGLAAGGYVVRTASGYAPTGLPFVADNVDEQSLAALVGADLARRLAVAGIHGLRDIAERRREFHDAFAAITGFAAATATLMAAAAAAFEERETSAAADLPHADLLHAAHVRPYQHEAHAALRAHGYHGRVIEAPAGSGKTLIGMLCIQDWLRVLAQGETIVVLVPTMNYEQQWLRELCLLPTGLGLPPGMVFTGSPAALDRARARGVRPSVVVTTYTALAQTGSGAGRGGFDQNSVEMFLQGNAVRHVILDEAHKVVEERHGVTADVARLLVAWLNDGSLRGLVGFSATAAPYRDRLAALGLTLTHEVGVTELIAQGYVAPFAELAAPFALSARERRIHDLLGAYAARLRALTALAGGDWLRRRFAALPLAERVANARDLLGMYADEPDRDTTIARRLVRWETGGALTLPETPIVTLLQLAHGWSDDDLIAAACATAADAERERARDQLRALLGECDRISRELRELLQFPDLAARLTADLGGTPPTAADIRARTAGLSGPARAGTLKDALAGTVAGRYVGLHDWYARAGEGRVDTIKAVIAAENAVRPAPGVIVFDRGRRMRPRGGVAAPGWRGVAGIFGELLGEPGLTPVATVSGEMYLPYDDHDPLPARVAAHVRDTVMRREHGAMLATLLTHGAGMPANEIAALRDALDGILADAIAEVRNLHTPRPSQFARRTLTPLRRAVRRLVAGPARAAVLDRCRPRNHHLRAWANLFLDYAQVAASFDRVEALKVRQIGGGQHRFARVAMPAGERRQLYYDLTARLLDDPDLPINVAVVSSWARTGWNVITPNVLIDATATRDGAAWRQLRGRAMRPATSWTKEHHDLLGRLTADAAPAFGPVVPATASCGTDAVAFEPLLDRLRTEPPDAVLTPAVIAALGGEGRRRAATALMVAHNKVTHIYELIRAHGMTPQVRWNRRERRWERVEAITAKHDDEEAIDPTSGAPVAGPAHAPLVYASDPRRDTPPETRARLEAALKDLDQRTVAGWLRAAHAAAGAQSGLPPLP